MRRRGETGEKREKAERVSRDPFFYLVLINLTAQRCLDVARVPPLRVRRRVTTHVTKAASLVSSSPIAGENETEPCPSTPVAVIYGRRAAEL